MTYKFLNGGVGYYVLHTLSEQDYRKSWQNKLAEIEARNFGVPLQMGEFTNYTSPENWEYALSLLNSHGWHWASWTYKVWGKMSWGGVNLLYPSAQKVDASADTYEEILFKFTLLNTTNGSLYAFANGITLEDVFKENV